MFNKFKFKILKYLFLLLFIFILLPTYGYSLNECFISAGEKYNIHPNILWAIAKIESNFNPKAINKNKNGTYDYGIMQINSSWYWTLGKENWKNLNNPCYNIYVGAWILKNCINKYGYTWEAISCYNTGSPHKGKSYTWKVYNTLKNVHEFSSIKNNKNTIKTVNYKKIKDSLNN